jgi:hypothetical protein
MNTESTEYEQAHQALVTPAPRKKKVKNYINNKDFHQALVRWKEAKAKDPNARMEEYIGECFLKIATGRARHPWYNGWSFKEDMISEAVLSCMKYAENYNIEKGENPFAYFTQYCNNAFLQVMEREKKLADFKFEMVKENQANSDEYDYNNYMNDEE